MFLRLILYLFLLPLVKSSVYLYNTHDNLFVEFYDCIIDTNLPYCRRPSGPITLQRDQSTWNCHHNGTSHSFTSLLRENVSVSAILHQWNSGIEKAEEYSRYQKQRESNEVVSSDEKYLCECQLPQSFGKHCEYLLPMDTTFHETIAWEVQMRRKSIWKMQIHSDIVCYTTLICNSGLLCLDWRDICDGVQHCMYGYDEENCDKLEFNECEDDEYRCANGMCIPHMPNFRSTNWSALRSLSSLPKLVSLDIVIHDEDTGLDQNICQIIAQTVPMLVHFSIRFRHSNGLPRNYLNDRVATFEEDI